MDTKISEHDRVVEALKRSNSAKYDVLANLGKEEHYIGQIFPDLILLDKITNKPVFIIEVKKNGLVAQCIQQWKAMPSIPATLYIVVPEAEIQNAKSIAEVVGLQTKFGIYTMGEDSVTIKFLQ